MKLETFFENFDQFAGAPDAVAKMRGLIRTFAVQGKLVPQNPKDEPAEDLVTRVSAQLPKKQSENPFIAAIEPFITDESQYDLPRGWTWLPLGHAGIWASGCGFPKQFQGEAEGEFLFCKVSDMNLPGNEVEIHTTVNSIDADVLKKIRARPNPMGTVIFPKIGGAIATHKRRLVIKPTIIDNNCSGIQPIGLTDSRWLMLLMRSIDLTRYQSGTSVPAVSQDSLDPIRIGLPPLAEQKRIVAKVDELMALCDRLEAQQQEREMRHAELARASLARFADAPTPANLPFLFYPSYPIPPVDLRKSILTLAIQGKLVPQNPNDEPAAALVKRIEIEKSRRLRDGTLRNIKPPAPFTNDDKEFELPFNWEWVRMGQVVKLWNGFAFKSDDFQENGIPVIRIGDLQGGLIDVTTGVCVSEDIAKTVGPEFWIPEDAVLIAMSGATTGKVAFNKTGRRLLLNQRVGRLEPLLISAEYVRFFFETIVARNLSISFGSAIPNLSAEQINGTVLPLPPLAEQYRIVAKVNHLMSLVDELGAQLANSRAIGVNLLDAMGFELAVAA